MDTENKFDINHMVACPRILIIGKRGTGKSWLVRDIMSHLYFDKIHIVAPTDRLAGFYSRVDALKDSVSFEYSATDLAAFLNECEVGKEGLVVLDDCIGKRTKIDDALVNLITRNKYLTTGLIYTMQFPSINQQLIQYFDYIFLGEEAFVSNIKRLYEKYICIHDSFDEFNAIFTAMTAEDFSFMVVDHNYGHSKIFSYKICPDLSHGNACPLDGTNHSDDILSAEEEAVIMSKFI